MTSICILLIHFLNNLNIINKLKSNSILDIRELIVFLKDFD
jgi:hypothetical protein